MPDSGDARRKIEALRERISALSAAILRITSTLDLDAVLAEAVDSARALTRARFGAVVTVDETGARRNYVLSGFTAEQEQEARAWPDYDHLFKRLRELPGPLRVADLPAYLGSLGFASSRALCRTLLGMPLRHRGADWCRRRQLLPRGEGKVRIPYKLRTRWPRGLRRFQVYLVKPRLDLVLTRQYLTFK